MRGLFLFIACIGIFNQASALTEEQHIAQIICMQHLSTGSFDNYAKTATFTPGYDICEKLLPVLMTLDAAEMADWQYQQDISDNNKLNEVAKQLLPHNQ